MNSNAISLITIPCPPWNTGAAYCLYKNGEYDISRFALEPVLSKGPSHPYYNEGLNLLALLEERASSRSRRSPRWRKSSRIRRARPYMRARRTCGSRIFITNRRTGPRRARHYVAKEITELPVENRYTAAQKAAECLANEEQFADAAGGI